MKDQNARNAKFPQMTELGKELNAVLRIKEDTMYKKKPEDFEAEYADRDIAELHYAHYTKRREKNLLKLQDQFRLKKMSEVHSRSSMNINESPS